MRPLVFNFKQFVQRFAPCGDRPLLICAAHNSQALFITQRLINYRRYAEQDSQTNRELTPARARALMAYYKSFLPQPFIDSDRNLFFKFSTNNLLYGYSGLVQSDEDFQTYIKRAREEGLINFFYIRRAGIRALIVFLIKMFI